MDMTIDRGWDGEIERVYIDGVVFVRADGMSCHEWERDDGIVLTTNPPKSAWTCKRCGKRTSRYASEGAPPKDGCPGPEMNLLEEKLCRIREVLDA